MERETTEIILPRSGAKVVLYNWLSNGQYTEIQKKTLEAVKMNFTDLENPKIEEFSSQFAIDANAMTIQFLIKEVFLKTGEKVEDVAKFVYDISKSDGDVLREKVQELSQSSTLSDEQKKN